MSDNSTTGGTSTRGHGRGRGKSRGGLGKYLRARGRGRASGRPAEFNKRLLLEGEGKPDLTEEETAEFEKELREKYGKRKLGSNMDRYKEEEVELDSDGEPIIEPEVDLSSFLEKQRISDDIGPTLSLSKQDEYDEDDVDTSLAHLSSKSNIQLSSKKGKVHQIEWDEELDEMNREKKAAEASRDLKERFKAKSEKLRTKVITPTYTIPSSARRKQGELQEAPALPLPEGVETKTRTKMEEMEDFLDDLLG